MSRRIKYYRFIQEACLMDDIFMGACLNGANDCIEYIIRVILGRDDLIVVSSEVQKVLKGVRREVRLDVLAKDNDGKIYNIEIQRADSGAIPERARYNLSMIDINNLEQGEDFSKLPDVYVIFITEHDVLGYGLPLYTIERRIKENGKLFNDRAAIIYVNCETQDLNTALGRLIHDFFCKEASEIYSEPIAERVRYLKEDREGVKEMDGNFEEFVQKYGSKQYAKGRSEGRSEGLAEGAANQTKEFAIKMLQAGKLSFSEIVQYTGLTMYAVRKLAKQLKDGK